MGQASSSTARMERYIDRIELSGDPKLVSLMLLSTDLSPSEKHDCLWQLAKTKISFSRRQFEKVEKQLMDIGNADLAQHLRFIATDGNSNSNFRSWCKEIIEVDIEGRWIVQREDRIRRQLAASSEPSSPPPYSGNRCDFVDNMKKNELKSLNEKYWTHHQKAWKLVADAPEGAVGRAFRTLRKNPNWHLNPWLREDCKGRGGCCGRDCGCCERSRGGLRDFGSGHCTSACHCCLEFQKLEGTPVMNYLETTLPYLPSSEATGYGKTLLLGYIFAWDVNHPNIDAKK